jgi:hypothetical protein
MNHLDDDAELYALGLTEPERGAEIEAHLAACEPCRARVVAAEEAAASLAAWWPQLATAAAVVFAATTGWESLAAQSAGGQLARTDVALTAIASSHFGHTTLTSDPGVVAKAIYARDGAWCYVVASGAPRGTHVVLHRGNATQDMGELQQGAPSTLFLRNAGRPDDIALVADGRVISHGKPAF